MPLYSNIGKLWSLVNNTMINLNRELRTQARNAKPYVTTHYNP